jgi:hypothetical protein
MPPTFRSNLEGGNWNALVEDQRPGGKPNAAATFVARIPHTRSAASALAFI